MTDYSNYTVTILPSQIHQKHKSLFGVKATHSRKSCKKSTLSNATEASTGVIGG